MITITKFNTLVSPLLGMTVSLPWHGYGSAIFLELGELQPLSSSQRRRHQEGEVCVALTWDWRIESEKKIICGSSNSSPEIEKSITLLRNLRLRDIKVEGRLPELAMQFDNEYILRSMAMVSGDPQWSIRLPDGTWLSCADAELIHNNGEGTGTTPEEEEAMDYAFMTAQRWGIPISEPHRGQCRNCRFFVPIDGYFSLLDYGVCTASDSPFDGKITNVGSGCPVFAVK